MKPSTQLNPGANAADRAELDEAIGLIDRALADAAAKSPTTLPNHSLRTRLLGRVHDSALQHADLHTARRRHQMPIDIAPGVQRSALYRSVAVEGARRPGEPFSISLLELAPGVHCSTGLGLAGHASEWLVLRGMLEVDGLALGTLDHHGREATAAEPMLSSSRGALVYLRDSGREATPAGTSRAALADWENYAPGIERRLLWQSAAAVAYIARVVEGALVPAHGHLHDEECMMIEGDLFTGDILLREGEFQLAPAGCEHGLVSAASKGMIYIRGDADLQVLPAG